MKTPLAVVFLSIAILGAGAWSQTPVPSGTGFHVGFSVAVSLTHTALA